MSFSPLHHGRWHHTSAVKSALLGDLQQLLSRAVFASPLRSPTRRLHPAVSTRSHVCASVGNSLVESKDVAFSLNAGSPPANVPLKDFRVDVLRVAL